MKYFAKKDANSFPIPGTMQGFDNAPCNDICNWVELPTEEMIVDEGETQYYHPAGLRFFVRLDCKNSGCLLPNSLFSSKVHPGGNVIEFKKIVQD